MKILSIETSCDETAVSIIEATGGHTKPSFNVLSNLVLSQIKLHEKYGGVFPSLAKREHSKNLVPLIQKALEESGLFFKKDSVSNSASNGDSSQRVFSLIDFKTDLSHEHELSEALLDFLNSTKKPDIDLIAVTYGPGLEPALWVGINAAKVLSEIWGIPVLPINHMEGHISSVLYESKTAVKFPALALLISGGHTELVLISDWLSYKIIGQTRDDAVGEAYDKVARMLGLPYPGGPQIAQMAEEARRELASKSTFDFPRPMLNSPDFDFSFSGLKTSVLYKVREIVLDELNKKEIALAFEDAVIETLVTKTKRAIEKYMPQTLIIAGGVIANTTIRNAFEKLVQELGGVELLIPTNKLSTDNALMIALAAYIRKSKQPEDFPAALIRAQGNVQLS